MHLDAAAATSDAATLVMPVAYRSKKSSGSRSRTTSTTRAASESGPSIRAGSAPTRLRRTASSSCGVAGRSPRNPRSSESHSTSALSTFAALTDVDPTYADGDGTGRQIIPAFPEYMNDRLSRKACCILIPEIVAAVSTALTSGDVRGGPALPTYRYA